MKTDSFSIRLFAMAAMVLDHAAVAFSGAISPAAYFVMRAFGRSAFLLFAFLTAEGARHTKSRPRYIFRLLLLGLLAEPFFDTALYGGFTLMAQNTVFTLLLAVVAVSLYERLKTSVPLAMLAVGAAAAIAQLIKSDYGAVGVITVLLFYFAAQNSAFAAVAVLYSLCMVFIEAGMIHLSALFSLLAIPLLLGYNGRRGRGNAAAFYAFYPLHLMLLAAARVFFA